jgi:RNA polymerase sigma factor (sigma-70 family)
MSTLFVAGSATGLTDGQLLERFSERGGGGNESGDAAEAAFAALVERHGPMVLRVCRGILRDEHAAEDAFQATFLVLARKAGSLWVRDSVGPWLHRVSRRVAARARAAAERRKATEQRAAEMASQRRAEDPTDFEVGQVLDEEIDRLPSRYRMPIILCDVEGCSYEEAARHLGCALGTLKSRLARARERLRCSLIRRRVLPATRGLGVVVAIRPTQAAVPMTLKKSTALVAVRYVAKSAATRGMVPPLVVELTEGVLETMRFNMMIKTGGFALALGLAMSGVGLLAVRASGGPPAEARPSPPVAVTRPADQDRSAELKEAEAKEKKARAEAREAEAREAHAKEAEAKEKKAKAEAKEAEAKEKKAKAEASEAEAKEKKAKAEAKEKKAKAEASEAEAKEAEAKEAEAKEKKAKAEAKEKKAKAEAKEKKAKAEASEAEAKEAEAKEKKAKAEAKEAEAKEEKAKAEANERKAKEASRG